MGKLLARTEAGAGNYSTEQTHQKTYFVQVQTLPPAPNQQQEVRCHAITSTGTRFFSV